MSAYVRANNGVHFANFDDVRANTIGPLSGAANAAATTNPPLQRMQNYEGGFKIQNRYTYVDASIYYKEFTGIPYTPVNIQNQPIGPQEIYGSTAKGVRLIGTVNPLADSDIQPLKDFSVSVNANYVDEKYKDFQGCFIYTTIQNVVTCGSINGQPLARTPKMRISVTPQDIQNFNLGSWTGTLTEFMTYEHVGQHYQDATGLNPLGTYYDLAAGIIATLGENWQLRIMGTNLTNQIGLTEGNARFGGNAVQNSVGFGRSIVGREGTIQLKYKF
jgi:hypothetical protein